MEKRAIEKIATFLAERLADDVRADVIEAIAQRWVASVDETERLAYVAGRNAQALGLPWAHTV
jgi:hypothetical protein